MRQPASKVCHDSSIQAEWKLGYLEGILLVYLFDWRRESSELVEDRVGIVRRVRSMTRTVGVLGGVDEPENGSTRRGHGKLVKRVEWRNERFTLFLGKL
jgi:hypothetical protein